MLPVFAQVAGAREAILGDWLLRLHDQAQIWLRSLSEGKPLTGQTPAYTQLVFAFGMACLGRPIDCLRLRQEASRSLSGEGEPNLFLLHAFGYRVDQALAALPHAGPLPTEQVEYLEQMNRLARAAIDDRQRLEARICRYTIDRLRQHSRILEPNEQVDPFRHWGARINDLDQALVELADVHDRKAVAERVQGLLKNLSGKSRNTEDRASVLRAGLEVAPRVGEGFARELLDQVPTTWDALPKAHDPATLLAQALFLESALSAAAHFGRHEQIRQLVSCFQKMLQTHRENQAVMAVDVLAGQCLRGLRKLGMPRRNRRSSDPDGRTDSGRGGDVRARWTPNTPNWPEALRALLHVASGWYYFGRERQAEPIVQAARTLLLHENLKEREKTKLACAYVAALGQAPVEVAQQGLEELFRKLTGIRDITLATKMITNACVRK